MKWVLAVVFLLGMPTVVHLSNDVLARQLDGKSKKGSGVLFLDSHRLLQEYEWKAGSVKWGKWLALEFSLSNSVIMNAQRSL